MFLKTLKVASISTFCVLATITMFSGNVLAYADNSSSVVSNDEVKEISAIGNDLKSSNTLKKYEGKKKIKKLVDEAGGQDKVLQKYNNLNKEGNPDKFKKLDKLTQKAILASYQDITFEEISYINNGIDQRGLQKQERNYTTCTNAVVTRRAYSGLFGALLFEYKQFTNQCFNGSQVFNTSRWVEAKPVDWLWRFNGNVNQYENGGNRSWSYTAYTMGLFTCDALFKGSCGGLNPWIRTNIYGNGSWNNQTGV